MYNEVVIIPRNVFNHSFLRKGYSRPMKLPIFPSELCPTQLVIHLYKWALAHAASHPSIFATPIPQVVYLCDNSTVHAAGYPLLRVGNK